MKRIFILLFFVCSQTAFVFGGVFWSLGYGYQNINAGSLLGEAHGNVPFFSVDAGYRFDSGLITEFRYDHIAMEDYQYAGENAKAVAVITSITAGWTWFVLDDRLLISAAFSPGYAVSVRYRRGITDFKTSAPVFTAAAGVYYNNRSGGAFYYGLEAGYRYLTAEYDALGGQGLNLSGLFLTVTLKHHI